MIRFNRFFAYTAMAVMTIFLGANAFAQGGTDAVSLEKPVRIVVFGDSLTYGFQLAQGDSFPVKLQQRLLKDGYRTEVINMSVPGETTSGGVARLPSVLAARPDVVLLELGINDALRGIDIKIINDNLHRLVSMLIKDDKGNPTSIYVMLIGMKAPPSMGYSYTAQFYEVYKAVAKYQKVAIYPFLLEGIAGRSELNLADGMHPNSAGVDLMVANLLPHVKHLLDYRAYAISADQYRRTYMIQSQQWKTPETK